MRRAALPLLALLATAALAAQATDAYALRHKPVKGEEQTISLKVDGKFGEVALVSEAEITSKITEVAADGGYTEEQTSKTTKLQVNGQDGPLEDAKTKTLKYDAKGHELDPEEDNGAGAVFALAFDYEADAPVKIGEKYRPEKSKPSGPEPLEWTLVGKERLGDADVLHLSAKGKGPKEETVESDIYLDPATFLLQKGVAKIGGVVQEGAGTGDFTITALAKK